MLRFKTPSLKDEFSEINPKLRVVLYVTAGFLDTYCNAAAMVTSLLRPTDEKTDPHYWGNAADIRTHSLEPDEVDALLEFLNSHIEYDGRKLVAVDERDPLPKGAKWTGPHIHIQVKNSTKMVKYMKSYVNPSL